MVFWFKGMFDKHPSNLFWIVVFIRKKIKPKNNIKNNKKIFFSCIWPKNPKVI
jgi:hypothetical protein